MILTVTSFSPDLYQASGKRLLRSFVNVGQGGHLFIAFEKEQPDIEHSSFINYDLSRDPFLRAWLEANKDIIPDYLGGRAPECKCPGREVRHAKHKFGCHWQWMNRNASRFFRKVAALRSALSEAVQRKFRYILWLDSDCVFQRSISPADVSAFLKGSGYFYFRGHRPVIESGIMGFDVEGDGAKMIKCVADCFASKDFRAYDRWDDGYIWTKMVEKHKELKTADLVKSAALKLTAKEKQALGFKKDGTPPNHVIPLTEMNKYINHCKGEHGRVQGVMR